MNQLLKYILFSSILSVTVACSESSSSSDASVESATGISMSIAYASGSAITASSTATVSFTFKNSSGVVVSNAIIALTTTLGTLSSSSVLTDSRGKATVTLSSSGTSGADTIAASAIADSSTFTASLGYQVDLTIASTTNTLVLALTNSAGATTTSITDTSAGTLKATLLDSSNNAVSGQLITFTTTAGTLSTATGLTDSAGVATILISAGTTAGAGTVTAASTISGTTVTSSSTFNITLSSSITPNITLTLKDGSSNTITAIRVDVEGKVTATLTDDSGTALASRIVQFETTLATLNPSSGSVLTNSSGVATISLIAGNIIGADSLTATVTEGTTSTVKTLNYSIDAPQIRIGNGSGNGFTESILAVNNSTVSAGGTASFTATLVDSDSALVADIYSVSFTSNCVQSNLATIDNVNTVNGSAVATYQASGCTGSDIITATVVIGGQTFTALKTITVSSDTVGSIQFISATPNNIALKGSGGAGRQEFSNLVFKVIGATGLPLANTTVTFSLNSQVGGISLLSTSVTTNSSGEATAVVQSGYVGTPVRVTAQVTVGSNTISSQSDQLTITTGLADQNSITIAANILAPEANFINTEVIITVNAADQFNHSVPDGTAVVVVTEGGAIRDSNNTCLTVDGTCNVTWVSQNPRPVDNRSTVMAYIIGTESFSDRNGNGVYDDGDVFTDLPEAYLDIDESSAFSGTGGVWTNQIDATIKDGFTSSVPTPTETTTFVTYVRNADDYLDFDGNGAFSDKDGKFNGVVCSHTTNCPSATTTFSGRFTHVRDSLVLIMAESNPRITISANNGTNLTLSGKSSSTTGGTLTNGTITAATLTAGSLTSATATGGTLTAGTLTAGSLTAGTVTAGTLTSATVNGAATVTNTTVTDVTVVATAGTGLAFTSGTVSSAALTGVAGTAFVVTGFFGTGVTATGVSATDSTVVGGTTTDTATSKTIVGGTTSVGSVTSGTISSASLSEGVINAAVINSSKLTGSGLTGLTVTSGAATTLTITGATVVNTAGVVTVTAGTITVATFTAGSATGGSLSSGSLATGSLTSGAVSSATLIGTLTGTSSGETTTGGTIDGVAVVTTYSFDITIEDPKALCLNALKTERIDSILAKNCTTRQGQSAPTGSTIAVSSGVGELSEVSNTTISSQINSTVFTLTVTPDTENEDLDTGLLQVLITTPAGVVTSASITLSDPIGTD